MAKARKPFVSRKRRKEMEQARTRREGLMVAHAEERKANDVVKVTDGEKQDVYLPPTATVGEFAALIGLPVVRVISQLMKSGVMASVTARIDFDTMGIVADELGFTALPEKNDIVSSPEGVAEALPTTEGTEARPPIVTIMGHVDHGKTSLLDKIRQANIAGSEHGGITQHIGAYQAKVDYEGAQRLITFLDTPGHEAFSALRSHGAQVTDIVVLVVAADDGVKPQTIEALNHAKSAQVPIIVAITKTDLPDANPERIKQQLVEYQLVPEEWGGSTIYAPVSSVTGDGIQSLLEYVVLTADLKGYKADPAANPQGVVIESHQETGLGPVATVLVRNGTLRLGQVLVIGQTYGKIRSMQNYLGQRVTTAGPSTPVQVSGLQDIPNFGESFTVVASEKEARQFNEQTGLGAGHRTIQDISQALAEGRADTLKIVLKADAQGSLEALNSSIAKLEAPGVKARIIHGAVGDVALSDIQLAAASQALVLGFQVAVSPQVKKAADNLGVTVVTHKIIYDLLQQIEKIMLGLVKVEKIRVERGRLKVKKIFRTTKDVQILGGEITQGVALAKALMTIQREGEEVGEGRVLSLQKGPEAVQSLDAGQDCGLSVSSSYKIKEGDMLIFLVEEESLVTD